MAIKQKLNLKDYIKGADGRKLYSCKCLICKKKLYRRKTQIVSGGNILCSHMCKNEHQKTGKHVKCKNCKKEVYKKVSELAKGKSSYCSSSCVASHTNKFKVGKKNPNFKHGRSSYRRKCLDAREHKCSNKECLLQKQFKKKDIPVRMLDVDHKNENRQDNRLRNLQILCVWCHALKTRRVEL